MNELKNRTIQNLMELQRNSNSTDADKLQRVIDGLEANETKEIPEKFDVGDSKTIENRKDVRPAKEISYRGIFGNSPRFANSGFKSMSDFLNCIHRGLGDERLVRSMTEGVPSDGGFLVPDEFSKDIINNVVEESIVLPRARVYPMRSDTLKVPGFYIGDHSSNLFGGLTISHTNEEATISEANPKTRNVTLTANKMTALCVSSSELAADGINFDSQITSLISQGIGWYLDVDFFEGTGVGQALGILNSPDLISVAKESGQAAATIVYENLVDMYSVLYPRGLKTAVWLVSQAALPQLLQLTIAVGTGGSAVPVMTKGKTGEYEILTRPVIVSEKLKALGTLGDIFLADFSQYLIGLRQDIRIDKSQHVYFTTDKVAWRGIIRVDGQSAWNEVLTLKDGSTEVSPFIALATRS